MPVHIRNDTKFSDASPAINQDEKSKEEFSHEFANYIEKK